jgi:NADPH:quinone reductase-like Zn-dependent oxidoreductase
VVVDLQIAVQDVDLVLDYVGGEAFEQRLTVLNKNGLVVSMNIFDCKEIVQQHDGLYKRSFIISMNVVQ